MKELKNLKPVGYVDKVEVIDGKLKHHIVITDKKTKKMIDDGKPKTKEQQEKEYRGFVKEVAK